ncbi:MAG: hypothetical protein IJY12_01050 [Clostridia bacterium]|nr:hypothetical protein [Clostridia bacterium]
MSLIFKNIREIIDTRCPNNKILSDEITVAYTLKSDDITKGKKPSCTPYKDRSDRFELVENRMVSKDTASVLTVESYGDGLILELTGTSDDLSEFGANLPINFMGKRGLGGWENQFLFNSPYRSPDKRIVYTYLTKPNGNNLVIAVLSDSDGWKIDYSPYSWGHYFINLKMLANYDKAYSTPEKAKHLKLALLPVSDFEDCLEKMSRLYGVPFLDYTVSGGKVGDAVSLISYGSTDTVIERHGDTETEFPFREEYRIRHEGEVELIPVCQGVRGAPITVYGYRDLISLYKKSMDRVDPDIVKARTNSNLCESQCWVSAMLRYLIKYGRTLTSADKESYESKLKTLLDAVTQQDESKAVPELTILNKPHDIFPAYNVYRSRRVQELHFGIIILLDAYKYFGDRRYYDYAVGATDCLLNFYYKDGRLEVDWGGGCRDDYTTVCSPMIALCDMANFLRDKDEARYVRYRACASEMAEFLYNRGLKFPTEGSGNDVTEEEMEDGSISCTALSLLYYCKHIEKKEHYVRKAKEVLDLHESWVMKTPICQMHYSTLRWWETGWEGDADGPALCCGHAWSIWRGEADYLYYELTGDAEHLRKAKNTFLTNLSKIQSDGTTYAIYNTDEINGGGFHEDTSKITYKVATRFASVPDCGLSRYVWIRMNDTFLQ